MFATIFWTFLITAAVVFIAIVYLEKPEQSQQFGNAIYDTTVGKLPKALLKVLKLK